MYQLLKKNICTKQLIKLGLIVLFFLQHNFLFADDTVVLTDNHFPFALGNSYLILKDDNLQYDTSNIEQQNFTPNSDAVPVFTLPVKSLWINFKLKNVSSSTHLYLSFGDPNISNIWVYEKTPHGLILLDHTGASTKFNTRKNNNTAFDISLLLQQNTEKEFYVHISSPHAIELPVTVNNPDSLNESNFTQILIIGLYCGIVISILLYNLFLFFATKDTSYLVYVIYLFTIGFAQISFAGWFFRFFWPSHPSFNSYIVISTSCLAGCLAIAFATGRRQ